MSAPQRYCEECGFELSPDAMFCENCGTQIVDSIHNVISSKTSGFISKTGFLNGVKCQKLFWYYYHGRPHFPKADAATQFRFNQGNLIGECAKQLFPEGMEAPNQNTRDLEAATQSTLEVLVNRKPLFEASVLHEKAYGRIDILNPVGNGQWDIYEVKSSTSVKDVHLQDVAFQKYVAESFGLNIRDCYLIHVTSRYNRGTQVDLNKLLTIAPLTGRIEHLSEWVSETIANLKQVLELQSAPTVTIGRHCNEPYTCDLKGHCWSSLPEHNVFTLYRGGNLAWELFDRGITDIAHIDCFDRLTWRQRIQYEAVKSGEPFIDHKKLGAFLGKLQYPLYHLDFETFGPAMPLYENVRPYQQVPFQFSLHRVDGVGAEPIHSEYLAADASDPRREFMEKLAANLGQHGSIITYNAAFEKARLRECCEVMPEYASWYEAIKERFVDLLVPFRAFSYYHPAQKGSASIKAVLPALTGRTYNELNIQDGASAGAEFYRVYYGETSEEERMRVREDLLQYCALDTLAMHWIHESLMRLP